MVGSPGDPRRPQRPSGPRHDRDIQVNAFVGAGLLVAALLLPHARLLPVGSGIALAGAIRWTWLHLTR
jgi:hypothetical protein